MNWVVKATPPVLLCRRELELFPPQHTVRGIRERTTFPPITYLEENVFPSKCIFSLGHKSFLMSMSVFHTITCLQHTEPSLCPTLNFTKWNIDVWLSAGWTKIYVYMLWCCLSVNNSVVKALMMSCYKGRCWLFEKFVLLCLYYC